jgi:transcriptional regulator with XRE-family HTH domain
MRAAKPKRADDGESTDARRAAFGHALREALTRGGLRQSDLAELLDTTQSAVSGWISGKFAPSADTVFLAEEVLGMHPGGLSRFLGYLPLAATSTDPVVEDVIGQSELVDAEAKKMMITVWRAMVDQHRRYLRLARQKGSASGR